MTGACDCASCRAQAMTPFLFLFFTSSSLQKSRPLLCMTASAIRVGLWLDSSLLAFAFAFATSSSPDFPFRNFNSSTPTSKTITMHACTHIRSLAKKRNIATAT